MSTPFDLRRVGGASTPPAAGPVKGRLRELVVFGADAVKESDRRWAARRSASTLHGFAIETGDSSWRGHRDQIVGASRNVIPPPTVVPAPLSSVVAIVRPSDP